MMVIDQGKKKMMNKNLKEKINKGVDKVLEDYGDTLKMLSENYSEDCKRAYIRGFFDADGCISKQNKIIITNTNENVIAIIDKFLNELNFRHTVKFKKMEKNKDIYRVFICSKKDVEKFAKTIFSFHTTKIQRFKKLLNHKLT